MAPTRLIDLDAMRIAVFAARETGLVVVTVVHHIFPLTHHAEEAVVEHEHLQRDRVGNHSGELLDVHLEASIAIDQHHRLLAITVPGADGCRQTEAHGAKPTGADPLPRALEPVVLGRPHLMLTDARHQGRMARGQPREGLDHGLRLDVLALAIG